MPVATGVDKRNEWEKPGEKSPGFLLYCCMKNWYADKWFWTLMFLIVMCFVGMFFTRNNFRQIDAKYYRLDSIDKHTNGILAVTRTSRDSSFKILNRIKSYRPLAEIMAFRDSVCHELQYKPGQVILLKPDSSSAVIESIIITGNKFEYSVKYLILTSNKKELQISPELAY